MTKRIRGKGGSQKGESRVILEICVPTGTADQEKLAIDKVLKDLQKAGFVRDEEYEPIVLERVAKTATFAVRGVVMARKVRETVARLSAVVNVWSDPPIEHFQAGIDCDHQTAKGTLSDVAVSIGANTLWGENIRGQGVTVGVCDDGVDAAQFPVSGGWSPPGNSAFGSEGSHGNMVANAVLGIAPEARLFDIGVLKAQTTQALLSNALAGFDWAMNQYKQRGRPHVLTNSWGIYQENWATDYATDPNHPFTRKVLQVLKSGLIVLFAAGNCGSECPDDRCSRDVGPGRSIWGANGHKDVITVAAVNIRDAWVGYSSQGPAALSRRKPDLCGITHFRGYNPVDTGTSAATPICAGVVALLKQADPSLDQHRAQFALVESARDLGPPGWDPNFGHGVVRAHMALKITNATGTAAVLHMNSCC